MGRKLYQLNYRKTGAFFFILAPLFFIVILFYIPLISVLFKGLNYSNIYELLSKSYYRKITLFTIYQAVLSSLLSVIIAIPGAYIITRYNFWGKKTFLSLSSLPFILPSILTVLGFVLLFGNRGILNTLIVKIFNLETPPIKILYSMYAVLLAHIFYNFPLAIRIISARWRKIPYELTEASYSLGKSKIETFFKVNFPFLLSSIITSFTLIFLYCFMSFGIILVLGGGPALTTIEVEVYRFARVSLDLSKAASLSIIENFITVSVLLFYLKSEGKNISFNAGTLYTKNLSFKSGSLFTIYLIPLSIMIIAPIISIIVNSFIRKTGFTGGTTLSLHWYKSIFGGLTNNFNSTAIKAIKNSIILGILTVIITIPLSLSVTYNINKKMKFKKIYSLLFFIPMGISSIIVGLSYMEINFDKSYLLISLAHTFISLPLAIRSINNIYKTIDYTLIEASNSLGYSRIKTFFKIDLPLLKSGIITATVFTFAISIGEMNASIMLAPPGFVTIPLAIYQLIGSYNFYGACALGTLLLILCLLSFRLIDSMEL